MGDFDPAWLAGNKDLQQWFLSQAQEKINFHQAEAQKHQKEVDHWKSIEQSVIKAQSLPAPQQHHHEPAAQVQPTPTPQPQQHEEPKVEEKPVVEEPKVEPKVEPKPEPRVELPKPAPPQHAMHTSIAPTTSQQQQQQQPQSGGVRNATAMFEAKSGSVASRAALFSQFQSGQTSTGPQPRDPSRVGTPNHHTPTPHSTSSSFASERRASQQNLPIVEEKTTTIASEPKKLPPPPPKATPTVVSSTTNNNSNTPTSTTTTTPPTPIVVTSTSPPPKLTTSLSNHSTPLVSITTDETPANRPPAQSSATPQRVNPLKRMSILHTDPAIAAAVAANAQQRSNAPKETKAIALFDYPGNVEQKVLQFKKDDVFIILGTDGDWWGARPCDSNGIATSTLEGFVPRNFVKIIDNDTPTTSTTTLPPPITTTTTEPEVEDDVVVVTTVQSSPTQESATINPQAQASKVPPPPPPSRNRPPATPVVQQQSTAATTTTSPPPMPQQQQQQQQQPTEQQQQQQQQSPSSQHDDQQPLTADEVEFQWAIAKYDWIPPNPVDPSFIRITKGRRLQIIGPTDAEQWWYARDPQSDAAGYVPSNFCLLEGTK